MSLPRVRIRRTHDLDTVRELNQDTFDPSSKLTDEMLDSSVWWLVWMDDKPIGFAGLTPYPNEGKAFLCRAGILPIARGAGLQKRLIRVRCRYAKKNGLYRVYTYTHTANHASMRSLITCGLKPYYTEYGEKSSFLYFENVPKSAVQGNL